MLFAGVGLERLLTVIDPATINIELALDPSNIAGIISGQSIYLTDTFGHQLQSGTRSTVNAPQKVHSTQKANANKQLIVKHEPFPAFDTFGQEMRFLDTSQGNTGGPAIVDLSSLEGTGPIEIVGVADFNHIDASGNQVFSFNPGSGQASELAALQSALQGQAVDMTHFLPPPLDTGLTGSSQSVSSSTNMNESKPPPIPQPNALTKPKPLSLGNPKPFVRDPFGSDIPSPTALNQQLDLILNDGAGQSTQFGSIMGDIQIGMNEINSMASSLNVGEGGPLTASIITQDQLMELYRQQLQQQQNIGPGSSHALPNDMILPQVNTAVDMTNFLPNVDMTDPAMTLDGTDVSLTLDSNSALQTQPQSLTVDGYEVSSTSSLDNTVFGKQGQSTSIGGADTSFTSTSAYDASITFDGIDPTVDYNTDSSKKINLAPSNLLPPFASFDSQNNFTHDIYNSLDNNQTTNTLNSNDINSRSVSIHEMDSLKINSQNHMLENTSHNDNFLLISSLQTSDQKFRDMTTPDLHQTPLDKLEINTTQMSRTNVLLNTTTEPDVPHVADLTADGIYPFEGSLSAMDATLSEGRAAVLDMTAVMEAHTTINDTLHLENIDAQTATELTGNVVGEFLKHYIAYYYLQTIHYRCQV